MVVCGHSTPECHCLGRTGQSDCRSSRHPDDCAVPAHPLRGEYAPFLPGSGGQAYAPRGRGAWDPCQVGSPAGGKSQNSFLVTFILNLALKLAPAGVFDSTMAILILIHHGLVIETLYANYVVVVNQCGCYLMYRILTTVAELPMQTLNFFVSFPPAVAAPGLPLKLFPQVPQPRELTLTWLI